MTKLKLLLILFIIVISISCEERFKDDEMMKQHHHHSLEGSSNSKITVHMICHSHDDVGWLKTLDDYFYGNKNNIQRASVQMIIESTIKHLIKHPHLKFVQVEIAFFYRWWINQTPQMHAQVQTLVKNGQLIFINGGWCMSDEATPYYEDLIDQMTIGHQWLLETFGFVPTIGWHIDPFGHQSSMASLFSQMGFNGWFFARVDYQDKEIRLKQKKLEMVWRPLQASGADNSIFSSVLYYHYSPPPDFNFDQYSNDKPIIDDTLLEGYNLEERAQTLADYFKSMRVHYNTDNLMHTFGEDFAYGTANTWFKNLDKLTNHINSNFAKYGIELLYSSPQQYLNEIQKENKTYPLKTDDFFPYADNSSSYWTGYFTSRTALKFHTKYVGRQLQQIRTWIGLMNFYNSSFYIRSSQEFVQSAMDTIEQAMGVLQHHDAVSGTSKQFVAYDYHYILSNASATIRKVINNVVKEHYLETEKEVITQIEECVWNQTAAECTKSYENLKNGQSVLLAVYNGRGGKDSTLIRVKVPHANFSVFGKQNPLNGYIYCEVFCVNRTDSSDCEAIFEVSLLQFELNYFKLVPSEHPKKTVKVQSIGFPLGLDSFYLKLGKGRRLKVFRDSEDLFYQGQSENFTFSFEYRNYFSYQQSQGQRSGAYIFRPEQGGDFKYGYEVQKRFFPGNLGTYIYFEFKEVQSLIRSFNLVNSQVYDNTFEQETFIPEILINDLKGKEITLNWFLKDGFDNQNTFYTDSNGLELQERKINFRPSWNLTVEQPEAGNYYPIQAQVEIRDLKTKKAFNVQPDRSQGATSLLKGQIQVMIQRRILKDDSRGVEEPLNETNSWNQQGLTSKMRHLITFYNFLQQKDLPRIVQTQSDLSPLVYLAETSQTFFNNQTKKFDFLITQNVDPFLKITLKKMRTENYLLRIHNMNQNQQINFNTFNEFSNFTETTLTANQNLSLWNANRQKWNIQNNLNQNETQNNDLTPKKIEKDNSIIQIPPLAFRTFIVKK